MPDGDIRLTLRCFCPSVIPWQLHELPAVLPPCQDSKGYLACGYIEITTVGSQDSITYKDMEALFSKFFFTD